MTDQIKTISNQQKTTGILATLFIGVLMGALDISIVGPAIPSIKSTIATEPHLLSWIFSIYVLFNLVGISPMAKLSDIFGRRNIYILSISIFAAGSLIVALSSDMTILLIGRAIQGLGSSGIFPVASAVIGDVFPPEKRGRSLGLIGAVFGIAFIIGPVIAGILLNYFSWNILFLVNIPIAIVLIWMSIRFLPSVPVDAGEKFDWKGVLLLAFFLSSFLIGVNLIDVSHIYNSFFSASVLPFFIIAAISFFIFLLNEKSAAAPVVNLSLFLSTQIRVVGTIAIGAGIFQSCFVFIPDMAVHLFQVKSSVASFMLLPVVLAIAIGSPISGRLIDKIGSKPVVIAGEILTGFGILTLSITGNSHLLFYLAGTLIGFGLSILLGSSLRYIILNEVSATERASTQGIITIFISIGQMVGAAFIGSIISSGKSGSLDYQKAFFYISLLSILYIFAAILLKNRKQELETIAGWKLVN